MPLTYHVGLREPQPCWICPPCLVFFHFDCIPRQEIPLLPLLLSDVFPHQVVGVSRVRPMWIRPNIKLAATLLVCVGVGLDIGMVFVQVGNRLEGVHCWTIIESLLKVN